MATCGRLKRGFSISLGGNGKCVNFRQPNVYASDGHELQLISMGRQNNEKSGCC